ncbi:hypothetical protein RHSIM_Rhsim03G0218900 [Rhododendron simsii]|uniref:TMPIT-like protein n=1 Tax=Rhododendron simsii TaxID=118357 RepID=A0A834LQH0_RHOSS|nr:hypothetical protein RHSIM_Rhsim03G0218900 [Rhododendron simsii]
MAAAAADDEKSENTVAEEVSRAVESAKELQDSASALISRNAREEDALRQRVVSLDSTIRQIRSSVSSLVGHGKLDPKEAEKLEEELYRASYTLSEGDAAAFIPSKSHGRFLSMFLGPINVRATRKDVKLKVKEEYNSFRGSSTVYCVFTIRGEVNRQLHFVGELGLLDALRLSKSNCFPKLLYYHGQDRTAFLFLVFPSLLLGLRSWIWGGCFPALPVQLYQAWLLFLYTGLALRENILRVNGSDIRPWWIYHHYFAMAMALISLTWEIEREPDCALKQRGVELFLQWAIMQGVSMLLQNRYQRQRLYTRIALGKARRMDVVWGETAGVKGQLWLLAPILFILQGFEAYVGMLLLKIAYVGVVSEWQVITCGTLLIIMAVGNFANTVQTLVTKSRFKAKMKKSKSMAELNHGSPHS